MKKLTPILLLAFGLILSAQEAAPSIEKLQAQILEQQKEIAALKDALKVSGELTKKVADFIRSLESTNRPAEQPRELQTSTTNRATVSNVPTGSISGSVFVSKNSGDSVLLRGTEVILCKDSSLDHWYQVMQERYRSADKFGSGDWYNYQIHLPQFMVLLKKDAVAFGKTSVDGKYRIPNVPRGRYTLFAQHRTAVFAVAWLVVVEVKEGEQLELDLDSSNASVILNK